jgi:hypothetical protein
MTMLDCDAMEDVRGSTYGPRASNLSYSIIPYPLRVQPFSVILKLYRKGKGNSSRERWSLGREK